MIQINNKQYRNLEEQVLFNSNRIDSIIEGNVVLGELGIKVVGQEQSPYDLPNPATYSGEYGDAYLIGTTEPYDFYIFTRPFQGQDLPQWFNLGKFPVAGPQGPIGPSGSVGPAGEKGNSVKVINYTPTTVTADVAKPGDILIVLNNQLGTNGDVYLVGSNGTAILTGSIDGPQGIQGPIGPAGPQGPIGPRGPQGIQGPQGESIKVLGEVSSIEQLPSPTLVDRNSAYLVPIDGVNHLFIIAGEDELYWLDSGPSGIPGPKGDTGATGAMGPQGVQGPQGPVGQAATIAIGTVTTGEPGTNVAITNSGDSQNAVFNFTIPRGAPGTGGGSDLPLVRGNGTYSFQQESDNTTTTAQGKAAIALGANSKAQNEMAVSIGSWTTASGFASFAGNAAQVSGQFGAGFNTGRANARVSFAIGEKTDADTEGSFAAGHGTKTNSWYQTAIGTYNALDSDCLFIVGNGSSDTSRSNCFGVKRTGDVYVGASAYASGGNSFAIGAGASSTGGNSFAAGVNAAASEWGSQAFGINTSSSGVAALSSGNNTIASHNYALTTGLYTKTSREAQLVCGVYNADEWGARFIVGDGTDEANRRNVFTAGKTGGYLPYIKVGNTQLTETQLQQLLNLLA